MSFLDLPPIIERMLLVSDKISDLNFSVGQPPQAEVIAMTLLEGNPDAAARLAHTGSADLSYSLPTHIRFRVNIFQQRGSYSIVMRVIPTEVPTLETLNLPAHLADIATLRNGIVLVTGPTGAGKTSTLAAIIDRINSEAQYHIITL